MRCFVQDIMGLIKAQFVGSLCNRFPQTRRCDPKPAQAVPTAARSKDTALLQYATGLPHNPATNTKFL
ncbi:hypothetical protein CA262_22890 [Sphingobium sp. GW456-12-10-14-TSB1]|uniref:Uncharacterized protein n=1 Tax=Sphingobium xenophagum TaxID=121428 RepID=A0A249MY91_SPHXE|nr:hypothetical protein CJD35_17910 [Sphingobium xenophagum]MBS89563.1 hypothetical protein [Sphingobium sp.]OUC53370.1 hypothetical protein CA262_22890 [Sphingobium sp. GW456-12-10-14-TSB1]